MKTREEIQEEVNQSIFGRTQVSATPVQPSQDLLEIRRKLDEEQKKARLSKSERESNDSAWTDEDSVAAAERFFSSVALGWGDEMQIWVNAQYESQFSDENYEDIHKRLRQEYDERQEEFKQRQPGAYTAADVAGSIASPVNFIPGVNVAARVGVTGSKAAKALQGVQTAGRVAAESAVYGAGEAGEGQRMAGAGSGAFTGLAGYGIMRGGLNLAGRGVGLVTRRNVEGNLVDEAGNFTPITLVAEKPEGAEGFLHTLYTDVVAPSFGGKGIITKQEKAVMEPLEKIVEEKNLMAKEMLENAKKQKEDITLQFQQGNRELADEFKNVRREMKEETKQKKITPLEDKLKLLDTKKAEGIFAKAVQQQQRIDDSLQHHFRNSAIIESMPAMSTSKDVADVLSIPDIQGQMRALDNLWTENGYRMIKEKKIRVGLTDLNQSFARMIESDDFFSVNAVDKPLFLKTITGAVEKVARFRDKSNRISGSKLAELRSDIGKKAAASTDPQMRAAFYKTQAQLDDVIREGLTPTQLKQFNAERARYKSVVVLRDAVESSAKVKGAFSPEDWHKSLDKNNQWDKRYGTGILRKEADEVISQINASKKSIGRKSNQIAKAKAFEIRKVIQDHRDKLQSRVEKLTAQNKAAQNRRRVDYTAAVEAKMNAPQITKMNDEIKMLDDRLAQLKTLSATANPSWFHTMAAHSLLGTLVKGATLGTAGTVLGGPVAGVALPAGAYALGRGLASPTGQKIVAGQTAPQMATQRFLQADATGRTADILSRSIGRTGLLTGAQQ